MPPRAGDLLCFDDSPHDPTRLGHDRGEILPPRPAADDRQRTTVNLFEPDVATRGAFLRQLRSRGWSGRVVWVPISAIAFGITAARTAMSLANRRLPTRLAAWSVLRPRRYDARVAAEVLAACR